jgi:hypothetical protein
MNSLRYVGVALLLCVAAAESAFAEVAGALSGRR